jgi:hypothetical protein
MSEPPCLSRRALLRGAGAAALAATAPVAAQVPEAAREAMARAATAFLAALGDRLRARAVFPFDHEERRDWHYVPRGRQGLPFKDMPAPARTAAHGLMKVSLSGVGYAKAVDIIRLEEVLRRLETFGALRRDPEKYHVTVFGPPGSTAPWGWRLEGHHLSLNFTLVPGRPVVVTPAFLGANPARVPSGPHQGLRVLGEEQDLGVALARSVDAALRPRLIIAADSFGDIVTGPGRIDALKAPAGVALGALGAAQRALGLRLIETYARTMRADVAEAELRRLREAGLERVHVAWAGPIDPARPHYYRLHGPTLLIEYDNTQNDANHVHTVWHDPWNHFGVDPLRAHYERGHHRPHA